MTTVLMLLKNVAPVFLTFHRRLPVYGSLTLSILTITQRHGDDGVVSSKCSVGNGRVMDEGWGDMWCVGGLGRFVCGGGGECALCIG